MALGNTATRIIVSVFAIPIILLASYFGKLYFTAFILLIGLVAFYEFAAMSKKKNIFVNNFLGFVFAFLLIMNFYYNFAPWLILFLTISFVLLFTELFRNKGSVILNVGATLLGVFYIGIFAGTMIGIRQMFTATDALYYQGGILIISIFTSIWICDSAAFFVGTAIGSHKLFQRVSPNKSWEGAIAGFLFSILIMIAAQYFFLDFISMLDAMIIGTIVGSIGQIGDLVESLIKRDAGVKDSSALIPGHGGILDRFDSLLFVAPVVYLYLIYLK